MVPNHQPVIVFVSPKNLRIHLPAQDYDLWLWLNMILDVNLPIPSSLVLGKAVVLLEEAQQLGRWSVIAQLLAGWKSTLGPELTRCGT